MLLTVKLCTKTELFEVELFFCIRSYLALNNLQRLVCHKTQTNKPNHDENRHMGIDKSLRSLSRKYFLSCKYKDTAYYISMCVHVFLVNQELKKKKQSVLTTYHLA